MNIPDRTEVVYLQKSEPDSPSETLQKINEISEVCPLFSPADLPSERVTLGHIITTGHFASIAGIHRLLPYVDWYLNLRPPPGALITAMLDLLNPFD